MSAFLEKGVLSKCYPFKSRGGTSSKKKKEAVPHFFFKKISTRAIELKAVEESLQKRVITRVKHIRLLL